MKRLIFETVLGAEPDWLSADEAIGAWWPTRRQHPRSSYEIRLLLAAIEDALVGHNWGGPIWQSELLKVQQDAISHVSLDRILGWRLPSSGRFVVGLAKLTPSEHDAIEFWLTPNEAGHRRSAEEIRGLLDRQRGGRGKALAVQTVENLLSSAKGKLQALANSYGTR